MVNYLDNAYELSKAETKADTYGMKKLINEIRFNLISDDIVDWKEYLFRLIETTELAMEKSYNEGYEDALSEHGIE